MTVAQPDFAAGWYALALAARRAGDCADAIPAYRRYAALRPNDAEPYFGLGLCLRDTGERPGAAVAFKSYLAMEHRPGQEKWIETAKGARPCWRRLRRRRGAARPPTKRRSGCATPARFEAALKRFADAVTLEPDLIAARAAWGELLLKIHRDADAVGVFRGAVERNPQYPLAWYELAFALRETGRLAEAVDAYRRYIPLRPNDPDPHYGLARALARLGRGDEALRSYTTYVDMENRPAEERWVASAKTEIAALEKAHGARPSGVGAATPAPAPPAPTRAPAPRPPTPSSPSPAPPPAPASPSRGGSMPPPLPPPPPPGGSTQPPPMSP